jgi:hypothetical protein
MLRDFGFTLGPAVIGAIAHSQIRPARRQQRACHDTVASP